MGGQDDPAAPVPPLSSSPMSRRPAPRGRGQRFDFRLVGRPLRFDGACPDCGGHGQVVADLLVNHAPRCNGYCGGGCDAVLEGRRVECPGCGGTGETPDAEAP